MIRIEFKGLKFFPSVDFTVERNLTNRYIPTNDYVTNSSVEWNGETHIVQSIFYNAFKIKFLLRETEKQGFEKIRYATDIKIYDIDAQKTIDCKFLDITFEKVTDNLEFYLCEFTFADKDTKNVQNTLYPEEVFNFCFHEANFVIPETYLKNRCFKPLYNSSLSQNVKNDFNNQIVDFRKLRKSYKTLLIFEFENLFDTYLLYLQILGKGTNPKIGLFSSEVFDIITRIVSSSTQFNIIRNELFGESLFLLELEVIESNTIAYPYS